MSVKKRKSKTTSSQLQKEAVSATKIADGSINIRIDNFQTPTPTPTLPTETKPSSKEPNTIVRSQPAMRPQARTVIASKPYEAAKRVDLGESERNRKTPWWLGPALIAAAFAMLIIGWLHVQRSGTINTPLGHKTSTLETVRRETQEKIEFYRRQVGHRMNRDRVDVEILNSRLAPGLDGTETSQLDRSMMRGVPLMQEGYVEQNYGGPAGDSKVRFTSRDRSEPVPIDRPDARIQYGLQEEQHRDEYDRRVQQQYIQEFVENARRDGVKIVLDKNANVIAVEPLRGDEGAANSRRPGSASPGLSN